MIQKRSTTEIQSSFTLEIQNSSPLEIENSPKIEIQTGFHSQKVYLCFLTRFMILVFFISPENMKNQSFQRVY